MQEDPRQYEGTTGRAQADAPHQRAELALGEALSKLAATVETAGMQLVHVLRPSYPSPEALRVMEPDRPSESPATAFLFDQTLRVEAITRIVADIIDRIDSV